MSEILFNTEINWHPFIDAHVRRFHVERCERWAQFIVGGFITVTIEDRGEEPKENTRWKVSLRGLGRKETAEFSGHKIFGEVLHATTRAVQRWRGELRDLAAGAITMPHTVAV